uniref:Complex 1 LYR protein domain-containing protein n=1 Tax=Gadus morhua TaxID=8049 RepID=A0A8C4ZRQ6_GADMO
LASNCFIAGNMATKTQVLSLYRMLLRESKQFPSYNYRTYALQRIKDAFRANRRIEDPKMVAKLAEEGHKTLALIKRQTNRNINILATGSHM